MIFQLYKKYFSETEKLKHQVIRSEKIIKTYKFLMILKNSNIFKNVTEKLFKINNFYYNTDHDKKLDDLYLKYLGLKNLN